MIKNLSSKRHEGEGGYSARVTSPGLTALLQAWSLGDASALERLTPYVYSELHRLAHLQMAGERPGHVLQPSALVNEAFVRLMGSEGVEWASRRHFFAAASRLMRQVLVDFARAEEAQKRGGRAVQTKVYEIDELSRPRPSISLEHVLAIDESLRQLESLDARQAQVVELRFFGGLENGEIAALLGISERTVMREWRLARAFLFHTLGSKT
jgi:RNA polymerase sigma factor (TIGR02999 family)